MTAPLSGLKGFVNPTPEATAEQRLGGPADPRHEKIGEQASPYAYEQFPNEPHGPYGIENDLLGMDVCSYVEGGGVLSQDPTADMTPITHAAPWPKGVTQSFDPDAVAIDREESYDIHSTGMGGYRESLYIPTQNPVQDDWVEIWDVDPGVTVPALAVQPEQMKGAGASGWGSRDRVQSNAKQNQYGFDSAHMHRRYAAGSIPGNYMWLEPGSRPLVKSIPGTAMVPNGVDSPYYGQDPGAAYDVQGGVLMTLPAAYTAPPTPSLATDYPGDNGVPVEWW